MRTGAGGGERYQRALTLFDAPAGYGGGAASAGLLVLVLFPDVHCAGLEDYCEEDGDEKKDGEEEGGGVPPDLLGGVAAYFAEALASRYGDDVHVVLLTEDPPASRAPDASPLSYAVRDARSHLAAAGTAASLVRRRRAGGVPSPPLLARGGVGPLFG